MASSSASLQDPETTSAYAQVCLELVRARYVEPGKPVALEENFDGQRLLAFAGTHGAGAALAGGARKAGLEGAYAQGMQLVLDAAEAATGRTNADMKLALAETGKLLSAAGITCCALKGGAFLAETDEPPGWRALSDLDLLVREDQVHDAVNALVASGFQHAMAEEGYRSEDHYHYPPLIPPGAGFAVELHTRFVWDETADPLRPEEVLHASLPSTLNGICIPAAKHRVTHLIAHAQIGDKGYAARRISLKDVIDLAELVSVHDIDWNEIDAAFCEVGKRPVMSGFLHAAQSLLKAAGPDTGLDLQDGARWAEQALKNYASGRTDQTHAAMDIARDYAHRVLFRKGGLKLLMQTLTSRERLASLWQTQSRKWRG